MGKTEIIKPEYEKLTTLIPEYYEHKQEYDEIDKICKAENADIKRLMEKSKLSDFTVDDITAKYIIAKKESFNEVRLLDVLKKHGLDNLIKTREYVDMDALENALYHNEIETDIIMEMDKCKESKETIQLRVSKKKGGKKDE